MLVLWCASFRKLHCTLSNFLFLPRALIPNPALALEQGNQYYHAVTRMVAEETTASTPGGFIVFLTHDQLVVDPSVLRISKQNMKGSDTEMMFKLRKIHTMMQDCNSMLTSSLLMCYCHACHHLC